MNVERDRNGCPKLNGIQLRAAQTITPGAGGRQRGTRPDRSPEPGAVRECSNTAEDRVGCPGGERGGGRAGRESSDTFRIYLREIGPIKLLEPREEIELARRVQRGDDTARERMIKGNLRLVVKIAREFEGLGLPLLDLISEGNIGLMKAVERFDPRRGVKLSSYASLWIRQSLRRALVKQAKIVRLPVNFQERLFRIGYVVIKLRERLAREPTDGEIAEELGLSVVKVKRARQGPFTCVSLDELQHDGQGTPGYELIADENAWTAYETVAAAAGLEMLEEFMGQLSLRERTVLRLRFGLEGEEEQTLEEVSRQVGLTREGVRQIQNKALQKLRRQIEKRESIPFRTSKSAVWNETIRHGRA